MITLAQQVEVDTLSKALKAISKEPSNFYKKKGAQGQTDCLF
jgi:hypothetical protein